MRMIAQETEQTTIHPLDIVEAIAEDNEWVYERRGDDEIAMDSAGRWCDYRLHFAFNADFQALHINCTLDMRVPAAQKSALYELISKINERLWLGHLCLWEEQNVPMFRHTVLLRNGAPLTSEEVHEIVEVALGECDRFYPAFQFVIWGGKTPHEALEAAMIETVGEA